MTFLSLLGHWEQERIPWEMLMPEVGLEAAFGAPHHVPQVDRSVLLMIWLDLRRAKLW